MNKSRFWALAKKEFFGYVNSPQAYVVMVPFILLSHFLYFRTALMMGDANLRYFIELLPWFLVVIGPALAMKSFADEYRKDTLELLYAHPASEWLIASAKLTGLLLFFGVFLLSTLALPLTLAVFSSADYGLMFSQYLGAFFIGGAFLAIGMAASAFVGSAVGGFLVGTAIAFALMLLGMQFVVMMFPGILGQIVNELAIMTHLTNVSRGVIDLRDLLYFTSLMAIAIVLTVYKLSQRKLAESPAEKRALVLSLLLVSAIAVAGNVFMSAYPIRLDLTKTQQYSLSPGTKTLLKNIPDRLTITLYTSRNLPAQMQVTMREAGDWMKDFSRYSNKIKLNVIYTDDKPEYKELALKRGIQEAQFNQIGNSGFQVQTGFLGMTLQHADKSEVIPFIENASDMEYQLSRLIIKLTQETQTALGLVDVTQNSTTSTLSEILGDQYNIVPLSDSSSDKDLTELQGVVVIDDGSQKNASVAALIKQYVRNNGNAVLFIDGVTIDQRSLVGNASISDFRTLFSEYGVKVNTDLVYDLQLNEAIQLPMGNTRVIVNYPFWMRGLVSTDTIPWSTQLSNILLGWSSSLEYISVDGVTSSLLAVSSKTGGTQQENYTINPSNQEEMRALPKPSITPLVLGVALQKAEQRMAILADHHIVTDDFLKNSQEDVTFITNMIDWVVADPVLSSIPKRTSGRNVFQFTNAAQVQAVQYGMLFLPALVAAGVGIWWLKRRRSRMKRVYKGT